MPNAATILLATDVSIPHPLVGAAAFVFGCIIGSFLNVVIHRVPRGLSVVTPRSACPDCGAAIGAIDNIPVLSWLFLGGECRRCRVRISPRYPLTEAVTGFVFFLAFLRFGLTATLAAALAFSAVIIALIFIDAEHFLLPNVLTFPLLAGALIARLAIALIGEGHLLPDHTFWPWTALRSAMPEPATSLVVGLLGAIVGGGSLWLVGSLWQRLRGVEAMGFGDVKMMAGVGAFLGWQLALFAIFLGAFAGAVIGIALTATGRASLQSRMPFGVYLGIGAIISLLFGASLINWYLATFFG